MIFEADDHNPQNEKDCWIRCMCIQTLQMLTMRLFESCFGLCTTHVIMIVIADTCPYLSIILLRLWPPTPCSRFLYTPGMRISIFAYKHVSFLPGHRHPTPGEGTH